MKKRLSKLLASLLTASLCVSAFGTGSITAAAADGDGIFWTNAETVPVNIISSTERTVNFNEGWKFNLGDSSTAYEKDFNDSSWDNVILPHDYSIIQDFTTAGEAESGFLPGGTGWYRKSFSVPQSLSDKSIIINFDGVYRDATVYLNGTRIGEHHYGYTSFSFDLTGKLVCDGVTENLIAVKVEHRLPSSRWYSGSGIYRDVNLIVTDKIHVGVDGTEVTTPDIANGVGTAAVKATIVNDGSSSASVTVKNTVYSAADSETPVSAPVSKSLTVPAKGSAVSESSVTVDSPKLWSLEEPNMYFVRTELTINGTVVDTYDTSFGFRWYEFDTNEGFRLNGKNIKLNGVCMHHDQGALGAAAYHDAIYRQVSILKEMGANAIRITHNPYSKQYLEACSQIGILAIEEFFDGWNVAKNYNDNDFSVYFEQNLPANSGLLGASTDMTWAEFAVKSVVKRDRNNPSLILWSLGNEIQEGASTSPRFPAIAQNLINWMKEEDSTRQATNGDNTRDGNETLQQVNAAISNSGGVVGFNYPRWRTQIPDLANKYPRVIASETASHINSRGIYTSQASGGNADGKWHLTSYDTSRVGWGQTAHDSMWYTIGSDRVAGQFVWTGFDYIGEPTPQNGVGSGAVTNLGAAPNSSYFGIIETTGFPKDNYYLYRSQWNQSSNTLHLVTAWDPNNMMERDGKTPVWIYSNAAKVELYRNGKLVGVATGTENTTPAGHKYYTYTRETKDETICSLTATPNNDDDRPMDSGTNEESLYSVFNVAFEPGTISAKAYDAQGNDITGSCTGNTSVSTPGGAAKLAASADKETILANGSSLSYITIDVKDAKGNLITTAKNTVNLTLEGNGEIVGVDNGDQSTTNKFQQRSVLKSPSSAKIAAYAGKALVIVRSTKQAGAFTLKAESEGLTGTSVTVSTTSVTTGKPQMVSYQLSRHCYVPTGTNNLSLPASVKASFTDGSEREIPIQLSGYHESDLAARGNYTIDGSFDYEGQTFGFTITLHVYDPIGGVQGFSYYTRPNVIPSLPASAMAYYTDTAPFEEYPVKWDTSRLSAEQLSETGKKVTVTGTVDVLGKQFTTQATIRVAEGVEPRQSNVALDCDHLVDNATVANRKYGDVLSSVTNGTRASTASSERWTTWSRNLPEEPLDDVMIAMDWATATMTDQINLFYYIEPNTDTSAYPTNVKFEYALTSNYDEDNLWLNAKEWIEINYTESDGVDGFTNTNNTKGKTFKLEKTINPQALRITFSQPANSFIGLNEIEVIGTTYSYYPKTSASLGTAKFKDTVIAEALEEGKTYETSAGIPSRIEFENSNNASLTYVYTDETRTTAKVIARSEDGSDSKTYTFTFTDIPTEDSKNKLENRLEEYENQTSQIDAILSTVNNYSELQNTLAQFKQEAGTMTESELQENFTNIQNYYKSFLKNAITSKITAYKALDGTKYSAGYTELQNIISNMEKENLDSLSELDLVVRLTSLDTAYGSLKLAEPIVNPPAQQQTTDKATVSDVEYQILTDTTAAAIGSANPKAKNITIQPSVTINGKDYNVTEISANAFQPLKSTLRTLTIGKNVTSIGKNAFNGCKKLSKITFKGTALKPCKKNAFKGIKKKAKVTAPKAIASKKRKTFQKNLTKTGGMKSPKIQYKK